MRSAGYKALIAVMSHKLERLKCEYCLKGEHNIPSHYACECECHKQQEAHVNAPQHT